MRAEVSPTRSLVPEHHDVTMAALAAIALPGGGQMYNAQRGKGLLLALPPLCGLFLLLGPHSPTVAIAIWTLGLLLWFLGIVDAALIAGRWKRHEPVRPWQWF